MKVTYNWLKEFVDFDLPPEELADLLTMLGLEVEGVELIGHDMDQVVVARVVEKVQHPNADKLSLCKVDNGKEILSVVCGAQNFKQGDTVALAQVGTVLPGDFKIKRSKIRGEESCGMLCSESELGLADESAGIMVLPEDLELGKPFFYAMGLKDTVFEIGLTPNRADCLSIIGVAREIAAKLGVKVRHPSVVVQEYGEQVSSKVSVTIKDSLACPRYSARFISGCKIAPSPAWLVKRLNAVGIRSINNVVDVTNLVMFELGHPLHAFDYSQVTAGKIIVRRAVDGEKFKTLDGLEHNLQNTDLLICDAERPVALAGIMGGENSGINSDSADVLLESAFFDPPTIRRTSKRLGLHTESSHRFERGADLEMVPKALDRAAVLIARLSGGTIAQGIVDNFPAPRQQVSVTFRPERANSLLGLNLSSERMADLFRNLEFDVQPIENGNLQIGIPSYRVDIEREVDLIEEICRLNGFDQIPATMPLASVVSESLGQHQSLQKLVRNHFVASGMNEVVNFSFISADATARLLEKDDPRCNSIKLCNPIAAELAVMRTSLLPGLLDTASRNISFRSLDLRLFEMRRIYQAVDGEEMPEESIFCAGFLSGLRQPELWCHQPEKVDFFDVKAIVESLLCLLQINDVKWSSDSPEPFYHPGKCCWIMAGETCLGSMGELHPDVLDSFEIEHEAYYFEFNFELLVKLAGRLSEIRTPSRFPDSVRDLALLAPLELPSTELIECVRAARIKELEDVSIFDLYQGDRIPAGNKSIALRLRYRSQERTLTDEDVQKLHQKVVTSLTNKLNVTVR